MRVFIGLFLIILIISACSTQKETVKPGAEEKPTELKVKKRSLDFSFEILKPKINSSLRGISVIDSLTIWASGSNGIWLRTVDGGNTWQDGKVKGFETLDFRDIEAFDKNTAIIMCVGAPAFFFKTYDGGKTWKRKYMNRDPNIFFDGFAFWDDKNGIAFSDPINSKFYIVVTKDGGDSWREISSMNIPSASKGEGGFAASGTSIAVSGKDLVWFGSGGTEKPEVYYSVDMGENWRTAIAPLRNGNTSSGVFSICFKDDLNGIAVGGDYKDDKQKIGNCVITDDGGLSWQLIEQNQPNGFRSCVAWNNIYNYFITTGTTGSDFSLDDGKTWIPIDSKSYNSIGISKKDGSCFMVGDKGAVIKVLIREFFQ
jgi:photosystem II stability/assembly factor-like uncharacterized protein